MFAQCLVRRSRNRDVVILMTAWYFSCALGKLDHGIYLLGCCVDAKLIYLSYYNSVNYNIGVAVVDQEFFRT